MKLLLDQDVYAVTARFLRAAGHDVVTAAELGLSRGEDATLMSRARQSGRILVTRDRDFGRLAFRADLTSGVLYLRMRPATISLVHDELGKVLKSYEEARLEVSFVVVEPGRHRIRRPLTSV